MPREGRFIVDYHRKREDRHIVSEGFVPLSAVGLLEDTPVDESEARSIAETIKTNFGLHRLGEQGGQPKPVRLATVNGYPLYVAIDGEETLRALQSLGKEEAFATTEHFETWAQVLDFKIANASTHPSVRFARLPGLLEAAWQESQWANRLSIADAFHLLTPSPEEVGVDPSQAVVIKNWLVKKCGQWLVPAHTASEYLDIASVVDPNIVKETRDERGGKFKKNVTFEHIREVAAAIPNQYELQQFLVSAIRKYSIIPSNVGKFAAFIAGAKFFEEAESLLHKAMNRTFIEELKTAADSIRQTFPEREVHMADLDTTTGNNTNDSRNYPAEILLQLSPKELKVIILHDYFHLPKADIAKILGASENNIRTYHGYAERALRTIAGKTAQPTKTEDPVIQEKVPFEIRIKSLTPGQERVLSLLIDDNGRTLTNSEIAAELYISENTIKQHLIVIFAALGVKNRHQAAIEMLRYKRSKTRGV